jgi:hypothetical protein
MKRKMFRNTLASVTVDTTLAKDDTNLHGKSFVFIEIYLSISCFWLYQSVIETGSVGQLAAFPLDV